MGGNICYEMFILVSYMTICYNQPPPPPPYTKEIEECLQQRLQRAPTIANIHARFDLPHRVTYLKVKLCYSGFG